MRVKSQALEGLFLCVDFFFIIKKFDCFFCLSQIAAHIVGDALVVEKTLDRTVSTDGKFLVPQLGVGEVHDVLGGDTADGGLDVFSAQAAASGDDLAANVFGDSGGAIERQEDGSLQLSLGALDLGLGDVDRETGPFAESEVDEVIEVGKVFADKVDTPETASKLAYIKRKA